MADFTLTADQHDLAHLVLTESDKWGNVIQNVVPDAGTIPTWGSDNTAVLTATAAADGLSADLVAVGPVGTANLTVSAVVNGNTITVAKAIEVTVGAVVGVAANVTFDPAVAKA